MFCSFSRDKELKDLEEEINQLEDDEAGENKKRELRKRQASVEARANLEHTAAIEAARVNNNNTMCNTTQLNPLSCCYMYWVSVVYYWINSGKMFSLNYSFFTLYVLLSRFHRQIIEPTCAEAWWALRGRFLSICLSWTGPKVTRKKSRTRKKFITNDSCGLIVR